MQKGLQIESQGQYNLHLIQIIDTRKHLHGYKLSWLPTMDFTQGVQDWIAMIYLNMEPT